MVTTGIGLHNTGVDSESFALDQAGRHARRNNALKEVPKDVTLPKAV